MNKGAFECGKMLQSLRSIDFSCHDFNVYFCCSWLKLLGSVMALRVASNLHESPTEDAIVILLKKVIAFMAHEVDEIRLVASQTLLSFVPKFPSVDTSKNLFLIYKMILEALQDENESVRRAAADIVKALAQKHSISAVPTLHSFSCISILMQIIERTMPIPMFTSFLLSLLPPLSHVSVAELMTNDDLFSGSSSSIDPFLIPRVALLKLKEIKPQSLNDMPSIKGNHQELISDATALLEGFLQLYQESTKFTGRLLSLEIKVLLVSALGVLNSFAPDIYDQLKGVTTMLGPQIADCCGDSS